MEIRLSLYDAILVEALVARAIWNTQTKYPGESNNYLAGLERIRLELSNSIRIKKQAFNLAYGKPDGG